MKIFIDNKNKICKHNTEYKLGQVFYKQDINEFADMVKNKQS